MSDDTSIAKRAREIQNMLEQDAKLTKGYQDRQRRMNRYAHERFLYRLGKSSYASNFILKGAMLLAIYVPNANRPSRDADFQLNGVSDPTDIRRMVQAICSISHDDGLTFDIDNITIEDAGSEREYPGYTIKIPARLDIFNCPIHLDIGFGEAIVPAAITTNYPSLLSLPKPKLVVYPISTVIAEKFEAIINLGMSNGRMKDFYDIATISENCAQLIDGETLRQALIATFNKRHTALPKATPVALTEVFYRDKQKLKNWNAFLKASSLPKAGTLESTCNKIDGFLMPIVIAALRSQQFSYIREAGNWTEKKPVGE